MLPTHFCLFSRLRRLGAIPHLPHIDSLPCKLTLYLVQFILLPLASVTKVHGVTSQKI